jgi:mannosyltransferase OCH1-like enzyme
MRRTIRKGGSKRTKKDNINKTIHQVYGIFDDGIPLRAIDVFYQNVLKTKAFCKKYKIKYKMWNLKMSTKLIHTHFKQYKKLWNDFIKGPTAAPIMRADFIRYCILYKYGGIYVDCDIHPIKKIDHLFSKDYFFVRWNDDRKNLPYNAILGGKKRAPIYKKIMEHCEESFYDKRKDPIYKRWKGRFVFQTTGHHMIHRVLTKNNVPLSNILDILKIHTKSGKIVQGSKPLFEDANASVWYSGNSSDTDEE